MNPMSEIFLGLAAVFVFWLWVFNADAALQSKTCAYLRITFKVGWRLFKAAFTICLFAVIGVILLMVAASEWSSNPGKHESRDRGSESDRFFGFANSVTWLPQHVWGGLVILLQLFTLATFLSLEHLKGFCFAHEPLCLTAAGLAAALYTGRVTYEEWKGERCGGGYYIPPMTTAQLRPRQDARLPKFDGGEK
jgi:hypothetical protein